MPWYKFTDDHVATIAMLDKSSILDSKIRSGQNNDIDASLTDSFYHPFTTRNNDDLK